LGSCDIPDLDLFPKRYPSVRTVIFRAGFASNLGHLAVWIVAGLVRFGLLPNAVTLASFFNRLSKRLESFISDKGGMYVKLHGKDHGHQPKSVVWHVIAAQNHGPHIPCGAAIALVHKLSSDPNFKRGAMPCVGLLTVEEYLAPLHGLDIREIVDA
jgi:hypothetical protein